MLTTIGGACRTPSEIKQLAKQADERYVVTAPERLVLGEMMVVKISWKNS